VARSKSVTEFLASSSTTSSLCATKAPELPGLPGVHECPALATRTQPKPKGPRRSGSRSSDGVHRVGPADAMFILIAPAGALSRS
jgi:hypothetical protein